MPELPDVEVFRQYLDATSLHKRIDEVEVRNTKILEQISSDKLHSALAGRSFESTRRHGKYLFVHLDDGNWLVLHFGMSGFLKYFKDMEKEPAHDRLLIRFSNGYHLSYDCQRLLGQVQMAGDFKSFLQKKELGPDALNAHLDRSTLSSVLAGRRGMVKPALMNQRIIAGIGNVYSDEILFHAKVHPKKKVSELQEETSERLSNEIGHVLRTAIEYRADPENMPESFLLPHRHKGGKCPRCRGEIEQIKVSGRTGYVCPKCQQ